MFPIPITLPINDDVEILVGSEIVLRSARFESRAVMKISEMYELDLNNEALSVVQIIDTSHPFVAEMHSLGTRYIADHIKFIGVPISLDFKELRLIPTEVRARLAKPCNINVIDLSDV